MAEFFLKSGCAFTGTAGFGHILAKNLRNSVGESGSGKSVAMLALMGLLPWTAQITADKLEFDGKDLGRISRRDHRKIFGKDISMIFQEPTSSLNPCFTVGFQIGEVLKLHLGMDRAERRRRSIELLDLVEIRHRTRGCPPFRINCLAG